MINNLFILRSQLNKIDDNNQSSISVSSDEDDVVYEGLIKPYNVRAGRNRIGLGKLRQRRFHHLPMGDLTDVLVDVQKTYLTG